MNREVRAPKGDIPSVPQANWQCNHDMARIRPRWSRLFDGCAPSAPPEMRPESRVFIPKRRVYPKFAFFQSGLASRLPDKYQSRFHCQKTHPMKVASLKQYHLCFSKRSGVQSLLLQISSTVHWHKQATNHSWLKAPP